MVIILISKLLALIINLSILPLTASKVGNVYSRNAISCQAISASLQSFAGDSSGSLNRGFPKVNQLPRVDYFTFTNGCISKFSSVQDLARLGWSRFKSCIEIREINNLKLHRRKITKNKTRSYNSKFSYLSY